MRKAILAVAASAAFFVYGQAHAQGFYNPYLDQQQQYNQQMEGMMQQQMMQQQMQQLQQQQEDQQARLRALQPCMPGPALPGMGGNPNCR